MESGHRCSKKRGTSGDDSAGTVHWKQRTNVCYGDVARGPRSCLLVFTFSLFLHSCGSVISVCSTSALMMRRWWIRSRCCRDSNS
jgi:hypothetical protein